MPRLLPEEQKFLNDILSVLCKLSKTVGKRSPEDRSLTTLQLEMCIRSITDNEPTMNELVERMEISTSTLYESIEKLQNLGLCKKEKDPEDQRIRRLEPTGKLRKILKAE